MATCLRGRMARTDVAWNRRGGAWCDRWVAMTVMALGLALPCLSVPAGAAELVNVPINGRPPEGASSGVAVNLDGSVVAFYSDAPGLVPGDTNHVRDVFVRESGIIERVSVSSDGEQGDKTSQGSGSAITTRAPAITGDGRIVAFHSDATNLVPDDTNGVTDVFVRDRSANSTERVSVSSSGAQANGPSSGPSMDRLGRYVVFQSDASNLVDGDENDATDIFVRDRSSSTTERLCGAIEPDGASFSAVMSADGQVVAFASQATNLVPNDDNGTADVFVCDRRSGTIEMISVTADGSPGNGRSMLPAVSADGRYVAFKSEASDLVPDDHNGKVDVFVRDRQEGATVRVSVSFLNTDSNDVSYPPGIDDSGRFVTFGSAANNIVQNDYNQVPSVFVRDMMNAVNLLVDLNAKGEQANEGTIDIVPAISGDGKAIGFVSFATNLAAYPVDQGPNVFLNVNYFYCQEGECPDGFVCGDNGICEPTNGTPTPSPTRTPGPLDCCECSGPVCQLPDGGACPAGCDVVYNAACLDSGVCEPRYATPTPTIPPTPTPTENITCPGDCKRDNVVTEEDLIIMTTIALTDGSVADCPWGDTNHDGRITVDEIVQAINQVGVPCP
jgi:Tol biopolymer transport system component